MKKRGSWCCLLTKTQNDLACLDCDRCDCDAPEFVTGRVYAAKPRVNKWTDKEVARLRQLVKTAKNTREIAKEMKKSTGSILKHISFDAVCAEIWMQRKRTRRRV